MSSPFTQARASLMSASVVFALTTALASCVWDTPESALQDTGASTEAHTLLAAGSDRATAHRFSDDYADALSLLANQTPEPSAPSF